MGGQITIEKLNRLFLRYIAESRITPLLSLVCILLFIGSIFLLSFLIFAVLVSPLLSDSVQDMCKQLMYILIDYKNYSIALIFGILTLFSWMLAVFIYQEVRTHIGGLDDLLKRSSEFIREADRKVTILAIAPNIGQAASPKGFRLFRDALLEKLSQSKIEVEVMVPKKEKITAFTDIVLKNLGYSKDEQTAYRQDATVFFRNIQQKAKGIILAEKPPFTAITIDRKVAVIVTNDMPNYEGFLSIKPYELRIIEKTIKFVRDKMITGTGFDLPTITGTGQWQK